MSKILSLLIVCILVGCAASHKSSSALGTSSQVNQELLAEIFIDSNPPVALIYLDGKLIGKTNLLPIKVTPGKHIIKVVHQQLEKDVTVDVKSGTNKPVMVSLQ